MKFPQTPAAFMLLLTTLGIHAQMRISYAMTEPGFSIAHVNTEKYTTLDSCYLTATYRFNYRASEKDDKLSYEDLMDLQMGRLFNAFYSPGLRDLDIRNTQMLKTTPALESAPDESVGLEIILNNTDSSSTVSNRIPFSDELIVYTEKTMMPKWTVNTAVTDTVMGYACHIATCNFGGREWKVWYTPDIPLPYGPWKLNGTDGLILKAEDTENNFRFEIAGLTQKAAPINRYDRKHKVMQKKDWQKFERDMYKHAGMFVRNIGANIRIMDNNPHNLTAEEAEAWTEFYNPLEKTE